MLSSPAFQDENYLLKWDSNIWHGGTQFLDYIPGNLIADPVLFNLVIMEDV